MTEIVKFYDPGQESAVSNQQQATGSPDAQGRLLTAGRSQARKTVALEPSQHESQENYPNPNGQIDPRHTRHAGLDGTPLLFAKEAASSCDIQGGQLSIHPDPLPGLKADHQCKSEHFQS
jgi:hypothetical protein